MTNSKIIVVGSSKKATEVSAEAFGTEITKAILGAMREASTNEPHRILLEFDGYKDSVKDTYHIMNLVLRPAGEITIIEKPKPDDPHAADFKEELDKL